MKKFLLFLTLSAILMGCEKKSVQLPQIPAEGVTNVYNHSQIWAFYDENGDSIQADINKNNIISTTHWIINIDKRLSMSQVVPLLGMIKNKRAKKTIHSTEGMHNYLNYADVENKTNALYNIDSLNIITLKSNEFDSYKKAKIENVIVLKDDKILVNNTPLDYDSLDVKITDNLSSQTVILCYDSETTYQKYLETKVLLNKILHDDCRLNHEEVLINL